jgi:hypothetical protein
LCYAGLVTLAEVIGDALRGLAERGVGDLLFDQTDKTFSTRRSVHRLHRSGNQRGFRLVRQLVDERVAGAIEQLFAADRAYRG